jgi:hypothetical protein
LQKNFLVPGEIPLAARSHRFFGNTLVKAGHLMRPSAQRKVPRGASHRRYYRAVLGFNEQIFGADEQVPDVELSD